MTFEALSDLDIVHRLKAGDLSVFPEFVRRYENKVYRLALKISKNEHDAQDIIQDVFLTIHRKIGTFQERSSFSSWLYRITTNSALMKLRRRKTRRTESLEDHMPRFSEDGMHLLPVPNWAVQPDDILLNEETRGVIRSAIDSLPEKYRIPFILQNFEDMSLKEIGSIMNLKISTVKIRLHRARLFLRDKLSNYYHGIFAVE